MGFVVRISAEEGQGGSESQLNNGESLLECTLVNSHMLASKGKKINCEYYANSRQERVNDDLKKKRLNWSRRKFSVTKTM